MKDEVQKEVTADINDVMSKKFTYVTRGFTLVSSCMPTQRQTKGLFEGREIEKRCQLI